MDDDEFSHGFCYGFSYDLSYDFASWYDLMYEFSTEPLPTVDGAVEVGDTTEISVSATIYDARPGRSAGMNGCGVEGGNGCEGALTRDGITDDIESRWSCATRIVDDLGPCQIEYTFTEPQDIVDIQVAFWKGDERIRTLEVSGSDGA